MSLNTLCSRYYCIWWSRLYNVWSHIWFSNHVWTLCTHLDTSSHLLAKWDVPLSAFRTDPRDWALNEKNNHTQSNLIHIILWYRYLQYCLDEMTLLGHGNVNKIVFRCCHVGNMDAIPLAEIVIFWVRIPWALILLLVKKKIKVLRVFNIKYVDKIYHMSWWGRKIRFSSIQFIPRLSKND